jgi:hypothetical protein
LADSSGISSNLPTTADGGDSDINSEIQQMNDAFNVATQTNLEITINKTIDGAKETAAQQRPNIG